MLDIFRRTFYVAAPAAFALALAFGAQAADIKPPVYKAPRAVISYKGCGGYGIFGTMGEAKKATVSGPEGVALSAYVAGGDIAGGAGYLCGSVDGSTWKAVEGVVRWSNLGANATNPAVNGSVNSRFGFTGRVLFGGINDYLTAFLPDLGTSGFVFPAPGANPHPYVFGIVNVDQLDASYQLDSTKKWQAYGGLGLGIQSVMQRPAGSTAAPVVLDVFAAPILNMTNKPGLNAGTGTASAGLTGGAIVGALVKF